MLPFTAAGQGACTHLRDRLRDVEKGVGAPQPLHKGVERAAAHEDLMYGEQEHVCNQL